MECQLPEVGGLAVCDSRVLLAVPEAEVRLFGELSVPSHLKEIYTAGDGHEQFHEQFHRIHEDLFKRFAYICH